jgi:AraC-like DNA-binding protein
VLRLRIRAQGFKPHTHDTLMLGVLTDGCKAFERERRTYVAPAGTVSIVNAHELHTGRRHHGDELRYIALYLPNDLVSEAAFGEPGRACYFRRAVAEDCELHEALGRLARGVASGASRLARESAVSAAMRLLVGRHGDARLPFPKRRVAEPGGVRKARELLLARYAEDLSVGEIANAAQTSRFHLMRAFRDHVGVPLHAYQLQLRIEQAKTLLVGGRPIVDVALELGFADQSHFTKRFRSLVGLPPGAYRRAILA